MATVTTQTQAKVRVLFVCTGNICRSPMAEAVFRDLVKKAKLDGQFEIKSAGTGHWHVGERPHRGTREVLLRHAIDVNGMVAKQVTHADLEYFEYIIAMDNENLSDLRSFSLNQAKASRLLDYAAGINARDVPDPYTDGRFELVYELVRIGTEGLLAKIRVEKNI
ncbi:MAG TPA: low molecular weight protein-tyrosine-phosphatase [Anaerolineae bacterium]|nr:low molecular weight protein-tyrosine-phosphatase [Anaerolineae bacterium]